MTRISSTLVSLSALACRVIASPQWIGTPPPTCQRPAQEFRIVDVAKPEYGEPQAVGGVTCPSGEVGTCQHAQTYEHSVGVTKSVSGGLELAKILGLSASYGYSWSTEDAVARGSYIGCPAPAKGSFNCGLQVRTQMVKTTGKVRYYHYDFCATDDDTWSDFEVVAPYLTTGGPNNDANTVASFEPCILSCAGSTNPEDLNCEGVRGAQDLGVPLCPGVIAEGQPAFAGGWCTAHITQRQRWQKGVGDWFMFDLQVFDNDKKSIYSKGMQAVNENGVYSVQSVLPYTIEIATTGEDNDPVSICYADQCFACDDNDGGDHGCTLGNGNDHGYDNGDREGDFGFSC